MLLLPLCSHTPTAPTDVCSDCPLPFLVRLLLPPAHPQTCTPAASASSFCLLLPPRTSRHVLQLRLLLLFVRPLLFSRNPQIQAAHSPPLKVNVAAVSLQHPVLVFETHGIEANPTSALAKRPGHYLESPLLHGPRTSAIRPSSQFAASLSTSVFRHDSPQDLRAPQSIDLKLLARILADGMQMGFVLRQW